MLELGGEESRDSTASAPESFYNEALVNKRVQILWESWDDKEIATPHLKTFQSKRFFKFASTWCETREQEITALDMGPPQVDAVILGAMIKWVGMPETERSLYDKRKKA